MITSDRLELILLSPQAIEALLEGRHDDAEREVDAAIPAGWPDEHDAGFLRYRQRQLDRAPQAEPWLVRAVVLRDPARAMIGHAGFHGQPGVNGKQDAEAVELGYTIFEPYRGRGYATEAARALMDWAFAEKGIRRFIASVAPTNDPSLAIVKKLGFVQTGEQWDDEDGLELVFELDRGAREPK
jgi:[ribosomal protein S5]-alanine N-acetyltransferase